MRSRTLGRSQVRHGLLLGAVCLLAVGCAQQPPPEAETPGPVGSSEPATLAQSSAPDQAPGTSAQPPPSATAGVSLESSGLGVVSFGAAPDEALQQLEKAFGRRPDEDSGIVGSFSDYGTCPGTEVRAVRWSSLTVLFTNGGTEFGKEGTRHFFAYTDSPVGTQGQPLKSMGLSTDKGVGLGSSVSELKKAYGDQVKVYNEEPTGPGFTVEGSARGALSGALSGVSDTDTVQLITGGIGCGE